MTDSFFRSLDVYHDIPSRSAAMNMAIDEALLEWSDRPCLRLYRWDHGALSFGYFGKFADVAKFAHERDLVRRWTGGGIVLHGTDLTYSVIIPAGRDDLVRSPADLYSAIHSVIRGVLVDDGLPAVLANGASEKISEACFANPVRWDVVLDGRKIAGAAQRRTRSGLLQQGSVQLTHRPSGFAERFARALCATAETQSFEDRIIQRANHIAQEKYAQPSWLKRR